MAALLTRAATPRPDTGVIGGLDIEVEGLEAGTRIVAGPFQVLRTLEDGADVVVR